MFPRGKEFVSREPDGLTPGFVSFSDKPARLRRVSGGITEECDALSVSKLVA